MITTYFYGFVSVFIVSLVSLVGVFSLTIKDELLKKYIGMFISLAIGALLGDAFIHIIPEAFHNTTSPTLTGLLIIVGILFFFVVEKFLHWHHHGEDGDIEKIHPVGKLILVTDGFHNFLDGMIIGVSFLASIPLGIATTIAVVLHEIPQEIGDFAVLIHSGYTKKMALWLNFLSGLTAMVGLAAAFAFGNITGSFNVWVLPISAGGFIYIAVADLIPELNKTRRLKHSIIEFTIIAAGVLSMVALLLIE